LCCQISQVFESTWKHESKNLNLLAALHIMLQQYTIVEDVGGTIIFLQTLRFGILA
jgi:hypothetical protein